MIVIICGLFNIIYTFSDCMYISHVNENEARVHFYMDDFDDEFTYWHLKVLKNGNNTIMNKILNSKPITIYLNDLDEWTDYFMELQAKRRICVNEECHLFNLNKSCNGKFKTIPFDLRIDQVIHHPIFNFIITGTAQVYNPQRFYAQLEIGLIEDWNFSWIKPNIPIKGVGAVETTYTKIYDTKWTYRVRLSIYSKEKQPVKEKYHSRVQVLHM